MAFEDSIRIEFGLAQADRGEARGFHIVERFVRARCDEMRFDRDQVVDQLRRCDRIIERDADEIVVLGTRLHAGGRARSAQRIEEIGADDGVGMDDGLNHQHVAATFRMKPQQTRARVIAVGRNAAWVVPDGEREPVLAALRKQLARTVLAPGDLVHTEQLDADRVVVNSVEPRSFALVRHTLGGRTKTMAANIDTVGIVAALVDPPPSLPMIDHLVAFAVQHERAAALILTKADLAGPAAAAALAAIYAPLDVTVLVVQPNFGEGLAPLRVFLDGRAVLLVGNSGVGKSSIFRALGGTATVGDISRFGRGRQTTTSARLFQGETGFLIDSPGIGEFILDPMPATELAALFVEMREPATRCRFDDCRHLAEPDCAVREAVAEGRITASRYESYREIARAPGVTLHNGRDF